MNTAVTTDLRITLARTQSGTIVWDKDPYVEIPGAAEIEYPIVTRLQLLELQSGVPEQIDRVLSSISRLC